MRYVVSIAPVPRARLTMLFVLLLCLLATTPRFTHGAFASIVLYPLATPQGVSGSNQFDIAGGVTIGGLFSAGAQDEAVIWSAPNGTITHFNSSIINYSAGLGTDGIHEVGYGGGSLTGEFSHALLWSGTAASVVDLNPTGFDHSYARAVSGIYQVGYGTQSATGQNPQALFWTGAAASAVNLNPSGFVSSSAAGVSSTQQVGGGTTTGGAAHALLWTGTAASAIDLNPAGFTSSYAYGVGGGQLVGEADNHAILWSGTAASAIDLNPNDFTYSQAVSTNGVEQVGYGNGATPNIYTALFWSGSAESFVKLQSYLPASDTWTSSQAYSVDFAGHIYGIATGTVNGVTGQFAVEWVELPEPGAFSSMGALAGALLLWRKRRPSF